jgi:hypothetical protein
MTLTCDASDNIFAAQTKTPHLIEARSGVSSRHRQHPHDMLLIKILI